VGLREFFEFITMFVLELKREVPTPERNIIERNNKQASYHNSIFLVI
jgi:hypothetical protein